MPESEPTATRAAAEALIAAQLPMLRAYLRHLLASPHDADDLAQDICVLALSQPQLLLRGAEPGAYLRGIARHLASRHQRRVRREPLLEEIIESAWAPHAPDADVPALAGVEGERQALKVCLERVPGNSRQVLMLRYQEGLNATQIGMRLKASGDAIRMLLLRLRQALARCIRQRLGLTGSS
jgi:RNA polymerase sigma-70 factor (ECF subfamily)